MPTPKKPHYKIPTNQSAGGVGENGVLRAPSPPRVVIPTLTPAQLQSAGQKGIDALRVKTSHTKIKCHVLIKFYLLRRDWSWRRVFSRRASRSRRIALRAATRSSSRLTTQLLSGDRARSPVSTLQFLYSKSEFFATIFWLGLEILLKKYLNAALTSDYAIVLSTM